jgi:hypothetical protein
MPKICFSRCLFLGITAPVNLPQLRKRIMKRLILGLALLALAPVAQAHEYRAREILAILTASQAQLEMVDQEGNRVAGIRPILTAAAAAQRAGHDSFGGACEEIDNGSSLYGCGLQIMGRHGFFLTFQAQKNARGGLQILGPVFYREAR